MRLYAYGRSALLVELNTLGEVLGLHTQLRSAPPPGMIETVPALRTLLVSFDPRTTTAAAVAADLRARKVREHVFDDGPEVEVPVRYDGEDLPEVARSTGVSVDELVRRHLAATYVVALIGFAPGFYFLAGGDGGLCVPRRRSPRVSVPKGAVALGGAFTGIYPRVGPGGWQIVGCTPAALWDTTRTPSALLTPGTRVRLVEVS